MGEVLEGQEAEADRFLMEGWRKGRVRRDVVEMDG